MARSFKSCHQVVFNPYRRKVYDFHRKKMQNLRPNAMKYSKYVPPGFGYLCGGKLYLPKKEACNMWGSHTYLYRYKETGICEECLRKIEEMDAKAS